MLLLNCTTNSDEFGTKDKYIVYILNTKMKLYVIYVYVYMYSTEMDITKLTLQANKQPLRACKRRAASSVFWEDFILFRPVLFY